MTRTRGDRLVTVGAGLALASLALTVDNLRRLRVPPTPTELAAAPSREQPVEPLAVLLPVRDEVHVVEECLTTLVRAARHWPGPARVVVLDDGSTDGTRELLATLAARPDLADVVEVVDGARTPPGWLGKAWACDQLARAAGGAGVLAFVDADVELAEHALTASVALLRESGLDLVCPYPRQLAVGVAERLVQPLLVWSWASTLPLGLAERSARPSLSAANGQLLVVDAGAYARAGGHAAVRGEVLEDIALLRAVKTSGGRGVVVDGSAVATCRMYDGWGPLRAGWTKSLWSAFGSDAGAAAVTALLLLVHVVPAAAALRGSATGGVGYLASVTARALVARRTAGPVWPDALAHPVSVLVLAGLTADSVLGRRQGRLRWKGRPVQVGGPVGASVVSP